MYFLNLHSTVKVCTTNTKKVEELVNQLKKLWHDVHVKSLKYTYIFVMSTKLQQFMYDDKTYRASVHNSFRCVDNLYCISKNRTLQRLPLPYLLYTLYLHTFDPSAFPLKHLPALLFWLNPRHDTSQTIFHEKSNFSRRHKTTISSSSTLVILLPPCHAGE